MSTVRPRDEDDTGRSPKRTKLDSTSRTGDSADTTVAASVDASNTEEKQPESLLPPSHAFLGAPPPVYTPDGSMQRIMETDVGISEYIGRDVSKIEGIIKQRSGLLHCFKVCAYTERADSQIFWYTRSILMATLYI